MDPNWRHIIPPGHAQVISEGHCIDECTQRALPAAGISIFAVLMQTYNIGSEIRLRQVRSLIGDFTPFWPRDGWMERGCVCT